MAENPSLDTSHHVACMRHALLLAQLAPRKSTNFCVGAVLIDVSSSHILSTGYSMELPGNTHAEQCCLIKYQEKAGKVAPDKASSISQKLALYTTMEPCNKRASNNTSCTDTILQYNLRHGLMIATVYVGVKEPEHFVSENQGRKKLEDAGIEYVHVTGLEHEILKVATAGHNV